MTAPARRTVRSGGGCGGRMRSLTMIRVAPSRDVASGQGLAEAQTGLSFRPCLRTRLVAARACADLRAIRPSDWRRPCYPAFSAVPATRVASRLEPQWSTGPQGNRQSRHQNNSATSADQLWPPVIHAQLSMMHFVYEIRVTLSTKKFNAFRWWRTLICAAARCSRFGS